MGSVYLSSRQVTRTLKPGQSLDETIDWQAKTVIVDSYTTQYLLIPNAPKFVQPGVRHAVIPLPSVGRIQANYQAPAGVAQPQAGPNDSVILTFLEDSSPTSPGIPTQITVPQYFIGTVIAAAGARVNFPFIPLPGTIAVGWVEDQTFPGNPHEFTISGTSTLVTYYDTNENQAGFGDGQFGISPWMVAIAPVIEPLGYTFTLDAFGHNQCGVQLYGYLSQSVVTIKQNASDKLRITATGAFPASWQSPNEISSLSNPTPVNLNFSAGAGSVVVLFSGQVNNFLRLFQLSYTLTGTSASAGFWQTTQPKSWYTDDQSITSIPYRIFDYYGGQLGLSGDGVQYDNVLAAATAQFRGAFGISQQLQLTG